jgi:hypothetical protein
MKDKGRTDQNGIVPNRTHQLKVVNTTAQTANARDNHPVMPKVRL